MAQFVRPGEPLSERVYRALRDDIIRFHLKPGEPLHEVQIATRFGLSRTPVREALRRLEADGLVTITPQRGGVVSEISLRDVIEAYQVRERLEPFAAALAAQRGAVEQLRQLEEIVEFSPSEAPTSTETAEQVKRDIGFHDTIMAMAGNETMRRIVADMRARSRRVQFFIPGGRSRVAWDEHRQIFDAIKLGDADAAKSLMQQHLAKAKARLIE